MSKYSDKAAEVEEAIAAVYENKKVNKKDDISGDFSEDSASYPTVKAVKGALAGKSNTGHSHTTSDISNFPSTMPPSSHTHGNLQNDGKVGTSNNASKNVVTDANGKLTTEDKPTIPTKVSDLTNDSGFITNADISNKVDKAQGSGNKNLNVVTDASGNIALEAKPSIPDVSGKEDTSNKIKSTDGWSGTPTDTHYPSEKLVKSSLDDKINKSQTEGLVKNDGTIDTTTYVNTTDSRLSDARTPTSHTHGNLTNDGKVGTSNNASKNVVTDANGKLTTENKPTIPTSSDYGISISKSTSNIDGNLARYTISQGGTALSQTIDIPKDYLVKSAELKTCTVADQPVTGYKVGDKYLDFVINTKDSSTSTGDQHLYILVSDLIDTYVGDNSTISVSNNTISVKSTKASYWDGKSDITTNDVDTEIESYLDALAEAINPSS